MSDKASRTEQPTAYKLNKAKEKGQVTRGREFAGALVIFFAVITLSLTGSSMVGSVGQYYQTLFRGAFQGGAQTLPTAVIREVFSDFIFKLVIPFTFLLAAVGIGGSLAFGGLVFTFEPLMFKFSKLNPIAGFARFFNPQSLFNLGKNALYIVVLGWISWSALRGDVDRIPALMLAPFPDIVSFLGSTLLKLAFRFSLFLLVVGIGDYLFSKFMFKRDMKMTKQEVTDESKNTEGNPQIKGRIRSIQMQRAYQRMIQAVPQATAVVTNPTHFAVAIRYEPGTMAAPEVVAKGQDHLALRIRSVAEEHGVPIVENRPLAQALYKSCDVGKPIPMVLYQAVAELLAYLYRTGKWRNTGIKLS